jgi:hypothetical protein
LKLLVLLALVAISVKKKPPLFPGLDSITSIATAAAARVQRVTEET